ncbi:hypothetical protein [Nonomuraea sp. NPDC048901]|uniref:hypothetical protein n=1 Tax=unclassified Nonomuraea TaxID=2593643 RepID=UPI0033CEA367
MELYGGYLGEVSFGGMRGGDQGEEEGESCVLIVSIPDIEDAGALHGSKASASTGAPE